MATCLTRPTAFMPFPSLSWRQLYRSWLLHRAFLRRRNVAYMKLWVGRLVFWGGAIGVGLLSVVFFRLTEALGITFSELAREHWWLPLLFVPAGGALLTWLTRRYFVGAEGSGIPQVIAEIERPEVVGWRPLLSLRIIVGKILIGAGAVGCGFSMGREGPTVQVGASLMNAIHTLLPPTLHINRRHLLIAGGAAGIAAAFNTPLAGIVFAIEELSRGVEARMSGLIITAIVLAGVVAQGMLGDDNYYGYILLTGSNAEVLKAVALAALVCGPAGGLFSRLLITGSTCWRGPIADFRTAHPVAFAASCGLLVAAIGVASGGLTFGSGYQTTRELLGGGGDAPWFYGPARFIATVVSYLSGLPGGIFAPSLAIGAGIGHNLAPLIDQTAMPGMLLVLCMAGFMAAVTQAPITSFIIVMEMVNGYSLVIGLMSVSLLSSGLSRLVCRPFYATLAEAIIRRQCDALSPAPPAVPVVVAPPAARD
jgi:H+/Cl- antiporter ClcA